MRNLEFGRRNVKSKILASLSLILSIIASVYMSFWGASYAATNLETGEIVVSWRTGAFHPILIIFIFFPIAGLVGIQKENENVLMTSAIGMFFLAMLSFVGAGLVFLPSAFLLIVAAVTYRRERGR